MGIETNRQNLIVNTKGLEELPNYFKGTNLKIVWYVFVILFLLCKIKYSFSLLGAETATPRGIPRREQKTSRRDKERGEEIQRKKYYLLHYK